MLLLGIGLLALMTLQIRSIRSNAFSNCVTVASWLARNRLENLRAGAWEDIPEGTGIDTFKDTDPDTGATRMVFTRECSVQTDISRRMKEISITVSWEQNGRPHQIAVNTRIARRE